MLPSRAFRNTGIPPAFRSLITPHASLPSTVAVQLRFRLGVIPGSYPQPPGSSTPFSTSASIKSNEALPSALKAATSTPLSAPPSSTSTRTSSSSSTTGQPEPEPTTTTSQALPEKMVPRLSLTFTCTASGCNERSTHQFSKQAYEKGIVLIQCPGCKNRHLIADHLGWFKDGTNGGKSRTIEDIVKDRGETVRRGFLNPNGDIEYVE